MSRATVRSSLTAMFSGGNIAGLTDCFSSDKKITSGDEFFKTVGDHSGALGFVFIEQESETRRSWGGTTGYKQIVYDVGLVIRYRHNGVDPTDAVDAGLQAMDEYDALIEAVKVYVRAHRTGHAAGDVFSIGEGDAKGSPDIETISDLPVTDQEGLIHIWGVVKFKVTDFTDPNA